MASEAPATRTDAYDCGECPSYCCTYRITEVKPHDQRRLAKSFNLTEEEFGEKYCRWENPAKLVLKQTPDTVLGIASCVFLDKATRLCKVWDIRPKVCRNFPGHEKCKWWDRWTKESGRKVVIMKHMPGLSGIS